MNYQTFLGILLIASSTIAFICGLFAVNGVFKARINKQLMLICSALLVWALGLAITLTAANEEVCLIGHVIAPIGWGPMSGLLLHFTLLLIGKDKLLKKWWVYTILYLPGLLMIYAFTILPAIGQNTDNFINTIYGWAPVVRHDGWDYFFYAYYLGFSAVNIILLLLTRRNTQDNNVRAQVTVLAIAYSIAYTLGTISDVLLEQMNIIIPQLAPIFSLIAIGAIVYSVYRYRPLHPENINQSEIILTDDVRKNTHVLIGFIFITASIINIIDQSLLYNENNLLSVNIFSLFLILIAVFIFLIDRLKLNNDYKDLLVAITYSIVIPIVVLRFVRYGSITVWAFMLLLMFVCLLYNKRIMLISVIISSMMTQIIVWAMTPSALVQVNKTDYILRLSFIVITALLAIHVNNIYIARLKHNSLYIQKRKLLAEISQELITAEEQNMDEKIYHLLKKSGKFIGCDRAYIVLLDNGSNTITYSCEWLAEGNHSILKVLATLDSDILQMAVQKLETEKIIKLPDAMLLSPEAGEYKKLLAEQNIRALINLPIKENDKVFGFLGFDSAKPLREWDLYSDDYLEIIASLVSDIIIRIGKEKKIKFLAYHDQLTQLPNRDLFKDRLQQAINQAKRTGKMVAVVFIDLDSFKSVNDTMGHDLGDELLTEVARILSGCLRNYDTVSRFGGDEFVLMINQLSATKDVINVMDKLMEEIHKSFNLKGQEFFITASAGVALFPQDGTNADTLIKNADTAMYKAKEMGKDRYLMCSKDMKDQVLERMKLTNYLYRALQRNQFILYYQPQVNVETNSIVGLEALLRWSIPGKGMINPATFIPLAEQTGLINPIGEWVLETACRQGRIWKDKGIVGLRMAVNVSINQLYNPEFVQQVDSVLQRTGLPPSDLELEITESAASSRVETIADVLSKLKKIGVSIAIDDFGTEYSSLSRLKVLPIDRLKMDMQFVHGIERSEKDQAIAMVIITLAKKMALKVVAEGVETKDQLAFLSKRMCDEIQGYYFYKPMPAEEIENLFFR